MKKNFFPSKQNLYKTEKKDIFDYEVHWNIYPRILQRIGLKNRDKVLDAGCGNGKLGEYLKNVDLYGFDFDADAVKRARKKGYKEVRVEDIENTDYKEKEFDITFCIQVIPYVLNPIKAFNELKRITREKLIISAPNFNWIRLKLLSGEKVNEIHNKEYHTNHTTASFFRKIAKENNLSLKIFYLSNRFGKVRNLFGNYLASEVVGVFYLK